MKIEVLHNYGSIRLGQQRIEPGIYDRDDARLFGLADYLVTNGHASVVEGQAESKTMPYLVMEETADERTLTEPEVPPDTFPESEPLRPGTFPEPETKPFVRRSRRQ